MDDEKRQKGHLPGVLQPDTDPPPPATADPDGPGPGPVDDPPAVPGRSLQPSRVNERLDNLYNEVDIVKMNSMRRIAEELNR